MIIGLLLSWVFMVISTLIFLAFSFGALLIAVLGGLKIKNHALRYLLVATVGAAAFTPTLTPYDGYTVSEVDWTDFLAFYGNKPETVGPKRMHLAAARMVKGLVTGSPSAFEVGWRPIFLVAASAWFCAIAIRYLWPVVLLVIGAYFHLWGWSISQGVWHHINRATLDPFIIGWLMQAMGIAFVTGSVIKSISWFIRWRKGPPPPPPPPPVPKVEDMDMSSHWS